MLVVTHEGTYELDLDGRGRTVERPCTLPRYAGGSRRPDRGVLRSSTSAVGH